MTGYFANPEQTRKVLFTDAAGETWLRTGDIARMDADGFFYILDRKKDMIIRSGLKIYPGRVEHVLRMHQKVKDVAVVGRADPHQTEVVVAVIVPAPPIDEQKQLADELRALCREHLAPYEVPQKFEFMAQLPRSALGKLLKRELRKPESVIADLTGNAKVPGNLSREAEMIGGTDAAQRMTRNFSGDSSERPLQTSDRFSAEPVRIGSEGRFSELFDVTAADSDTPRIIHPDDPEGGIPKANGNGKH